MKKNYILIAILSIVFTANAQTTIFKETFGTTQTSRGTCTTVAIPGTAEVGKYDPQKNEQYVDHVWSADSHIWSDGVVYTQTSIATANPGACDDTGTTLNIRTNNPSTFTDASGDGNLYFNANINNSFSINGVNTSNYSNINLSFGVYGKNKADVTLIKLQYNNGSGLTDLGVTQIAALSTTKATWLTVTGITLPASTNLNLTFSTPTLNGTAPIEIRLDDIKITGILNISSVNSLNADKRKVLVSNSTLTLEGFTTGNVEIYNTQGKKVFNSTFKECISTGLTNGLYILKIGDFRQKISL